MAGEKNFENRLKKWLEAEGIYPLGEPVDRMSAPPCGFYEKRWGGSRYVKSGLPDMRITVKGIALEVELKATDGTPSVLQKRELQPTFWFIENPRGGMRKMDFMKGLPRYTLTYCQYGDMRMKPTDIFTNHPAPRFKPPCHNGDPCHVAAPRGARTGTQGLKNHVERSRIPDGLCNYIVQICEDGMNYKKFFEKAGD